MIEDLLQQILDGLEHKFHGKYRGYVHRVDDPLNMGRATQPYQRQHWVELHNPCPTNEAVRKRNADRFPEIKLFPARSVGPTWDAIQKRFFAEGGVFDQIYAKDK